MDFLSHSGVQGKMYCVFLCMSADATLLKGTCVCKAVMYGCALTSRTFPHLLLLHNLALQMSNNSRRVGTQILTPSLPHSLTPSLPDEAGCRGVFPGANSTHQETLHPRHPTPGLPKGSPHPARLFSQEDCMCVRERRSSLYKALG